MQTKGTFYFRRKRIMIVFLFIAFVVYFGISKYQGFQNSNDSLLPDSTLAPDVIQQQVASAVGTIPGLQELFVSQLADGSFIVHATVDDMIGSNDTGSESKRYQSIAFQFMNQVYGVKLHIKSAELYIVQDGRMVFGMGVGNHYKELMTSIPVSAGEDKQTPVIETIQKINNQDEAHPDQIAWIEMVS